MNLFIKKTKAKVTITEKGKVIEKEIEKEWLWVNFTLHGKRYRRSLKLENSKENMKYAKDVILPKMAYQLNNGDVKKYTHKTPTVDEYMPSSFELNEGGRTNSTTTAHWGNYNKHIKNVFGRKKLDEINPNEITRWQNSLQKNKGLSAATIKKVRGLLYTMYEDAIREGIIKANPLKLVKTIKDKKNREKQVRAELNPFTTQEIELILNSVKGQDQNLLATLLLTGLRAGECIALKWQDIEFEKNRISIRKQIVQGEYQDLKTPHSIRRIPIVSSLMPFLKEQGNKMILYLLLKKQKSIITVQEKFVSKFG